MTDRADETVLATLDQAQARIEYLDKMVKSEREAVAKDVAEYRSVLASSRREASKQAQYASDAVARAEQAEAALAAERERNRLIVVQAEDEMRAYRNALEAERERRDKSERERLEAQVEVKRGRWVCPACGCEEEQVEKLRAKLAAAEAEVERLNREWMTNVEMCKTAVADEARADRAEAALRLCVLKRRGGTTLDAQIADEAILEYVKRADGAARAALRDPAPAASRRVNR